MERSLFWLVQLKMSKNNNKNQYGSFSIAETGNKKYTRYFVAAFMVAIFVFSGVTWWQKTNKPEPQAALALTTGIPGWWYQQYFGSSICEKEVCQPDADPDRDKLTNAQEFFYNSHPTDSHTVDDEMNDGELVAAGFDPSRKGRKTFDEVASESNIFDESLVFDQDLKQIINETANINALRLPEIGDNELKIVPDSEQSIRAYIEKADDAVARHFPNDRQKYIEDAMASKNPARIYDVQNRLTAAEIDLRKIEVPVTLTQMHKYSILFLRTVSKVIDVPTPDVLADEANPVGNMWYDNTQILALLYQKMDLELNRLLRLQ